MSFWAKMGIGALGGLLFWFILIPAGRARNPVFDLGYRREYPPGTVKHFIFYDAFLISDEEGIYALSSICTGCGGPTFYPAKDPAGEFICRRHHSLFDINGNVVRGPAVNPLPWLKLTITRDGRLILHRAEAGKRDLKIPHGEGAATIYEKQTLKE